MMTSRSPPIARVKQRLVGWYQPVAVRWVTLINITLNSNICENNLKLVIPLLSYLEAIASPALIFTAQRKYVKDTQITGTKNASQVG